MICSRFQWTKYFGGQNFRRTKIFGGQNFRQQVRFSAVLSAENLSDKVSHKLHIGTLYLKKYYILNSAHFFYKDSITVTPYVLQHIPNTKARKKTHNITCENSIMLGIVKTKVICRGYTSNSRWIGTF